MEKEKKKKQTANTTSSKDKFIGLCDHWPRARHPGMWSQVGLRKHHYEQS